MDVRGARKLHEKIEARQLEHWRLALAVREGEQDPVDPDRERLVSCRDGVREYEHPPGTRFVKRLVDGRWETATG